MNATEIQIAQGDNGQTFGRLVREQQDWLYNLAYRLTGDARVASAAVEQTLGLAWRDLPALRPASARVWLARIAVRACCAELSRRGCPTGSGTPPGTSPAPPDGSKLSAQEPGAYAATEEGIQCCLDRLPLEERIVVVLIDVLGLNYAEAAQVLGKPASTVSRLLARARVRLGALLKAEA